MTAVAPVEASAPPRTPHRERRSARLAPWLAFVAATLPLVVAAAAIVVRRPAIRWAGDRALTELGVRGVLDGHQLLGIGGRFGWRHPGPVWLQLLVPLYELTAHAPWSLSVGAIAIHVAMIGIAIAVVARAVGARGAAVLAAGVAVYLWSTGMLYWTNLWAGYAIAWPLLALIAVAAFGSSSRPAWALPAAVLIGTLLVQTDVSTAVVVVMVTAAAIVLAGVRYVRSRPRGLAVASSRRAQNGAVGLQRALVAGALSVLAVAAWVPPLIQQLTHHPGNITLLVRFARSGAGGHPIRVATASVGAALSVLPLGARWVLHPGLQEHLGAGPWWAVMVAVLALVATAGTAVIGWKRGRTFGGDLAFLSAVGIVAAVISMSRVAGPINYYLLIWATLLPVTGLTSVVLVLVPGPQPPRRDPAAIVALAVAAAVALAMTALHGTDHDWDRVASRDVAAQTALAVHALGPSARGLVRVHVVTSDTWPYGAGVALQLQRHRANVEVDPAWVFLFGDQFAPGKSAPNAEIWVARPHEAPALAGVPAIERVGRVDGVDVYVRRD